jgi:hypothetical protein
MTVIRTAGPGDATSRRRQAAASKITTRLALGIRAWRHELLVLALIAAATVAGYAFVVHSAARAMENLTQSCAARFEIELQRADNPPPPRVLLNAMCRCLAQALAERNSAWQLALVQQGWRDLQALEPVTEDDEMMCVDAIVEPEVELAER